MKKSAFTLIEILLYAAIVGVILLFISGFIIDIIDSKGKNDANLEIQNNANLAIERITQDIRNAQSIIPQASDQILVLNMTDMPNIDLIMYIVLNNRIYVWPNAPNNEPIPLTSEKISVSNLSFNVISDGSIDPMYPDNPIIQTKFDITHVGIGSKYNTNMKFQNSAEIRSLQ
ncbi:type II secretion system protein J [Patescibacteria group bacterium]